MNTHLKIAWRNLWRNKRRTLITSASILFGVFFSIFMSSLQKGSMENMVDNMVRFSSGYIQIQEEKYKDNPGVNHSFQWTSELEKKLDSNSKITAYTTRIQSYALASSGDKSFGSVVMGIDPIKENSISEIKKWVSEGSYLKPFDKGALLGDQLAKNLGLKLGDTLALWGQGYHGVSAAGLFVVKGLLKFPIQDLNNSIVYIDIEQCRTLFSLPKKITSCIIMVGNEKEVAPTLKLIRQNIPSQLKGYSWDELQPELQSLIDGKLAGGKIIISILFMVIGFGIWGTIIMLMAERRRELGIMTALGVRKIRSIGIILLESAFIGLLGVMSGIAASFPLVYYFFKNPIRITGETAKVYSEMGFEPVLKFSIQPEIFLQPAIIVLFIFTLISAYPVAFILKLKTAIALRA